MSSGAIFSEYDKLIGGDFFEHVPPAADPTDLDAVHQSVFSKEISCLAVVPFMVDEYTRCHAISGDFNFDIKDRYRASAGLPLSAPSDLF